MATALILILGCIAVTEIVLIYLVAAANDRDNEGR